MVSRSQGRRVFQQRFDEMKMSTAYVPIYQNDFVVDVVGWLNFGETLAAASPTVLILLPYTSLLLRRSFTLKMFRYLGAT